MSELVPNSEDVDAQGRLLHPDKTQRDLLPEGKGVFWHWGPNHTADPVVITTGPVPRVLLIQRQDTGQWALPGGFIDADDPSPADAARRELFEETTLTVDEPPIEIYSGVVDDPRSTKHAWPETHAYLFQVDRPTPVKGQDDALNARWMRLDQLDNLYGSHTFLIEKALQALDLSPAHTMRENVLEAQNIRTIEAGHMAYDHLIVENGTAPLFIKQHVPNRFTDPIREAHSRAYLKKEASVYEHLSQHAFLSIPEQVELIDDTMLAMNGLTPEEGWLWRVEPDTFNQYVNDALRVAEQLSRIPPYEHLGISPSYDTMWREGWDSLTPDSLAEVAGKSASLSSRWSSHQQHEMQDLQDALPTLLERSATLSRTPTLYFAHNDFRQANIAWHKDHGVRVVDWSWADPAPAHADSTMLLVDLAKSGHDISAYSAHINTEYLVTLIGFWLAHSMWETRDGDTTVRQQQLASASTAYKLLKSIDTLPSEDYS